MNRFLRERLLIVSLMTSGLLVPALSYAMQAQDTLGSEEERLRMAMQQEKQENLVWSIRLSKTIKKIKRILDAGANPNLPDEYGIYPLCAAIESSGDDSVEIVELLLSRGAEIEIVDAKGRSIFHRAWLNPAPQASFLKPYVERKKEKIKMLLKHGAHVDLNMAQAIRDHVSNEWFVEILEKDRYDLKAEWPDVESFIKEAAPQRWQVFVAMQDFLPIPALVDFVCLYLGAHCDYEDPVLAQQDEQEGSEPEQKKRKLARDGED